MTGTSHPIDKRDFDANRPLLQDIDTEQDPNDRSPGSARQRSGSRHSRSSGEGRRSDDGLLNDVVGGIIERDRRKMQKEVIRITSFAWGVVTWYVCTATRLMLEANQSTRTAWAPAVSLRSHYTDLCCLRGCIIRSCRLMLFPSPPR